MFNLLKEKSGSNFYILQYVLLFLGVLAGSVYLSKSASGADNGIQTYLVNFIDGIKNGVDKYSVFKSSLKSNIFVTVIIFICAFFKAGIIPVSLIMLKEGFISGFTSSAFIKYYGIKGVGAMLCIMPSMLIYLPILVIFSSVSCAIALKNGSRDKNILISFIFFSIAVFSVFCGSSLCEGYVTTIFMKLLSKVL